MLLPIFTLMMAVFGLGFGIAGIVLARGGSVHESRRCCNHCDDGEDED